MATTITKTFSVTVLFSKDDETNLAASNLQYTQMLANMTKRIGQEAESQMGIVSSHIVGSVGVT